MKQRSVALAQAPAQTTLQSMDRDMTRAMLMAEKLLQKPHLLEWTPQLKQLKLHHRLLHIFLQQQQGEQTFGQPI